VYNIDDIIQHIRSFGYMEGINRTEERTKEFGEVFTHQHLAVDAVNRLEQHDPTLFTDTDKLIIDPACGDGMLLGEVLVRRLERGCDYHKSVLTLRGLDIHEDNIIRCRKRLCWKDSYLLKEMEKYLIIGDGLTNTYSFDKPVVFGNGLFEVAE